MSAAARLLDQKDPEMTSTTTRPSTRRRIVLAAGVLAALALLAAAANPVVHAVSGHTVGELLAERDGSIVFSRYDRAGQVPPGVLPSWFPRAATAVAVARPGPETGGGDATRIDAAVPTGAAVPATCTPSSGWSMPFTVPADWPAFRLRDLRTCGQWTLAGRSGHWYLWEAQAALAPAG